MRTSPVTRGRVQGRHRAPKPVSEFHSLRYIIVTLALVAVVGDVMLVLRHDAPLKVSLVGMSDSRVAAGQPVTMTATVQGEHTGASAVLQYRTKEGSWVTQGEPVRVTGSTVDLPVETHWYGVRRYRALFTFASPLVREYASPSARINVKAPGKPSGSEGSYALLSEGIPARWDPCEGPITYRVDTTNAWPGALEDVNIAFQRVAVATGLQFQYVGAFPAQKPLGDYRGLPTPQADIVVKWALVDDRPKVDLDSWLGVLGVTHPSSRWGWFDETGKPVGHMDHATITLNGLYNDIDLPGFNGRMPVLMHEIGHAVGLGHVKDENQIMNAYEVYPNPPTMWGKGDLTGFKQVGAKQGCMHMANPMQGGVTFLTNLLPLL